ncbi:MAG TPA: adenosine deaminase [Planctomycetota bacterium]|nr:adenosine deaminase [Planctomycetota bacterium]
MSPPQAPRPDLATLRAVPKVVLHDHLDGALRPRTIVDLARETGYRDLPTNDSDALAAWFRRPESRGSLREFLKGFVHTIGVLQTPEAIERVAYEYLEDCAEEGIAYAECRFAPCFLTQRGLTLEEVARAALRGFGRAKAKLGVGFGVLLCGMRDRADTLETAELAVDLRDQGVVGFDLAGEEAGFPPKRHLEAFQFVQRANFSNTIHAGEAFGLESIWQALQYCGAHRIGHGIRLADDIAVADGRIVKLGRLAQFVLDKRIPLEVCLTSNILTGAVPSLERHPFPLFFRAHFRVTLNPDDRLMCDTTATKELDLAVRTYGLTFDDVEKLTINAMKSAFIPYDERCRYIYEALKPGFARVREGARGGRSAG